MREAVVPAMGANVAVYLPSVSSILVLVLDTLPPITQCVKFDADADCSKSPDML